MVMPAYNAARTLRQTYDEVIAHDIVDEIILVDDASRDETAAIARTLDRVRVEVHPQNRGYGGNQKTCYRLALAAGADVVIMLHPDYQYTPTLIPAMASMVTSGLYPCVLASRILGGGALRGGMPWWKYVSNRLLTLDARIFYLGPSYPSIIRVTAPSREIYLKDSRWRRIPMISFSIIKCWPRSFG